VIRASSATIEGAKPNADEMRARMDTYPALFGYAAGVRVFPESNTVVVAQKGRDIVVFALPSQRWLDDLYDDGWKLLYEIRRPE
jgi:hypothetical protein